MLNVTNTNGVVRIFDDTAPEAIDQLFEVGVQGNYSLIVSKDKDGNAAQDTILILGGNGHRICAGIPAQFADPADPDTDTLVELLKSRLYG